MSKNYLNRFLWSTFLCSYTFQLIIFFTGRVNSPLFPFLMWIPGIFAIVFSLKSEHTLRKIGWSLRKWWYVIPAIAFPLGVIAVVVALLENTGLGEWSNKIFIFHDGLVDIPHVPLILGSHSQPITFFLLNLFISLLLQSLAGCIFTFGEELGWRGYAQEEMIRKYGVNRGLLILGIIWGYWHLPVILMGYNFPNHPVLGALLLMPLGTTFLGIVLGWFYLRSRSIWIPALAHAAINLSAMMLFTGTVVHQNELFRQLLWIGIWGAVAGLCLISLNRSRAA